MNGKGDKFRGSRKGYEAGAVWCKICGKFKDKCKCKKDDKK